MADKKVRYLKSIEVDTKEDRYCRFRKKGFKYIDYKDADFLLMLCNPQGKILPRRLTGVTAKQQRQLARAVKQARILGFLQFLYKE